MPTPRSCSLLTAVVVASFATGCFLSGDYQVKEETVTVPGHETTEEVASSSADALPSEVTPTPPSVAPPTPTTTTSVEATSQPDEHTSASPASSSETSPVADSSTAVAASSSAADSQALTSEGNITSEPQTSDVDTNGWQGSNNWWDSSGGRCWQGNCTEGCSNGDVRGPEGRCYWFNAGQGTWNQGKTACSNHGTGWLPITVHNDQEDGFVSAQVDRNGETWIGAQYSMGKWRWIDDDAVFWNGTGANGSEVQGVYHSWGTGEPSGSNGETCGRMESFNGDMRWGDSECNEVKLFACQSPAP